MEEHWESLHLVPHENTHWGQYCMTGAVESPSHQEAWDMQDVLDMPQTVECCSKDLGHSGLAASQYSVVWSLG